MDRVVIYGLGRGSAVVGVLLAWGEQLGGRGTIVMTRGRDREGRSLGSAP